MKIEDQLRNEIHKVLVTTFDEVGVREDSIVIERPNDSDHGDFSTNIAMRLAGQLKRNPIEIAEEVKSAIEKLDSDFISSVDVAGPGFINFFVKKSVLYSDLNCVLVEGVDFGKSNLEGNVIVEFSSPNIAKPFTVGHLRSTIIGDSIAKIHEFLGYKVFRDNHLGDWGAAFGKYLAAFEKYGTNLDELLNSENPVKNLVDIYIKFNADAEEDSSLNDESREWFKKLEEGDETARKYWQSCIDISFVEFDRIYALLGISFTENEGKGFGESFFEEEMKEVLKDLVEASEKGLLDYKESEGAQLVFFDKKTKMPPLMILKSNGTTLYSTRDLATDRFRKNKKEYGYPNLKVINEVGGEQKLYWEQIFKIEEDLGWYKPGQRVHVGHGHYRFKEGKMSTRKGNVIWLDDILKTAVEKVSEIAKKSEDIDDEDVQKVSEVLGIGAIKWNDLKRDRKLDITFDWDEIVNIKGDSGPYVVYTYARARSILRKINSDYEDYDPNQLKEDFELDLISQFGEFGSVVEKSARDYAPHYIAQYVHNLAQKFNNFYNSCNIQNSEEEQKKARLALTAATAQVIKNALNLLGIETVEKM